MGWKNVKDHYKINTIVQVDQDAIRIGNIDEITVSADGKMLQAKNYYCDGDLGRILKEMQSDPAQLRSLVITPDNFENLITVWTYDRNSIIEKQCEVVGWPNCCTDGELQNHNTHSSDRAIVVRWAIENATARVKQSERFVQQAIENLNKRDDELEQAESDLKTLKESIDRE